jgi:hypothetical protein
MSINDAFGRQNPAPLSEEPRQTTHVLPLLWSLYYAISKRQWRELRERHKRQFPDWAKCDCPKRCEADTFDEKWEYDRKCHIKAFMEARFICRGCHWLKSPGARMKTWTKPSQPLLKAPHIVDCLGWAPDRVDQLRARDILENRSQQAIMSEHAKLVQTGKSIALPAPIERLTAEEIASVVRPGQAMLAPWRVDLSRLSHYGYAPFEIEQFELRMYDLAAKRMKTLGDSRPEQKSS